MYPWTGRPWSIAFDFTAQQVKPLRPANCFLFLQPLYRSFQGQTRSRTFPGTCHPKAWSIAIMPPSCMARGTMQKLCFVPILAVAVLHTTQVCPILQQSTCVPSNIALTQQHVCTGVQWLVSNVLWASHQQYAPPPLPGALAARKTPCPSCTHDSPLRPRCPTPVSSLQASSQRRCHGGRIPLSSGMLCLALTYVFPPG